MSSSRSSARPSFILVHIVTTDRVVKIVSSAHVFILVHIVKAIEKEKVVVKST